MLCIKCQKEIPDGSAFCNHCGKEQNPKPKKRSRKRPQGSGTIRKDDRNKSKPWVAISPSSRYGTSRVYLGAFRTYKEAQDAIEKYEREGRPELYGATLEDIYKLWSETHFKNVSASAVSLYTSMWKRFEPIKGIRMVDLRTSHVQQIMNGATSKSAAEIIKALASMLCRYAMQNDVVQKNYADFAKIPKFEKKEKLIFTQEQISTLWEHSDDKRVQIILFLIYTGLRIGELATLTTDNVHLSDGYFVCGEKTEAGRNRVVPIPASIPELAAFLSSWIKGSKGNRIIGVSAGKIRDNYFYAALVDLGIVKAHRRDSGDGYIFDDPQHLTPHSCRHTFASLCSEAGMRPEQLQKIIGHANFNTTADVYIHSDLDKLQAAMSKLKK